jgi:hypothetical protein
MPEAGVQVTGTVVPQARVAVGFVYVTVAEHWELEAPTLMLAGQVIIGVLESNTVTLNVHWRVLLLESVAAQVTIVAPIGNVEPEAGVQTTGTVPLQTSDAVGIV